MVTQWSTGDASQLAVQASVCCFSLTERFELEESLSLTGLVSFQELRLAIAGVHEIKELEQMRHENQRLSDQRMADLSESFHSAETDKVKRLRQKLEREKRERRRLEEKNKSLRKVRRVC